DAGAFVDVGPFGLAGLGGAAEAVLRAEDRADVHPTGGVHRVHDADQTVGDDAGRVGDDADPATVEHAPAVGVGHVGAGQHRDVPAGGRLGVGSGGSGHHAGGYCRRADTGTGQHAATGNWGT